MSFLAKEVFSLVIDSAPLVSIDLIVENEQGQILLGFRNNRPAQGWWFVPGGRIQKNERLDDAFMRLTREELGFSALRSRADLLDIYEHFYEDSVFGDNPNTHYVVAGYHLKVKTKDLRLPLGEQHEKYQWFEKNEVTVTNRVHQHSIDYLVKLLESDN